MEKKKKEEEEKSLPVYSVGDSAFQASMINEKVPWKANKVFNDFKDDGVGACTLLLNYEPPQRVISFRPFSLDLIAELLYETKLTID